MDDLTPWLETWPVDRVAAGVTDARGTLGAGGDTGWRTPIASVSKLLVGAAALIALEEEAITLDDPAGPPGSTVRHLLAHTSGVAFDDAKVLAAPGQRRIYSNVGIEMFAAHLTDRTGIPFGDYVREAVTAPLGMTATELTGSPAHGFVSTVDDLLRFARELLNPTLFSPQTLAEATQAHFPTTAGVVPAVGRFDPNPWGLTFEIRGDKDPHWTGRRNSPRTFGHFGASGAFLWVDPQAGLATVALTDRRVGPWALETWPSFSDAVLERYAG